MIYDEEMMIKDAEAVFKANLNAEIAAVNAEKNDSIVLETIPDEVFVFESLTSNVLNYKGFFVMFGLVETPPREAQIDNFIEDVTITFQVATFDKGEADRTETLYKLLRYRRALKQVIIKNSDVFRNYAKPLVASLKPNAFPYDRNRTILSSGIDIKASSTAN